MTGHLGKNAFYIGEQASVHVDIDNTDCGADIKSVQATLVMKFNLSAKQF